MIMKPVKVSHDLYTHMEAWRTAIIVALECAERRGITHDSDDVSYWKHELKVFDRVFSQLHMLKENGQISID